MRKLLIVLFVITLMLISAVIGAKNHHHYTNLSFKVKHFLGIKSQRVKIKDGSDVQNKRYEFHAKSILDQPSKLNLKDHEAYLDGLKRKYANTLPIAEMITIQSGSYKMGCQNKPCPTRSLPVRDVTVESFQIGATEVTFEQWDACVAMGGCFTMPGDLGFGRGNRPVFFVSWDDVTTQYLRWLNENTQGGYRLPSEAEWEYAARATTTTKRYWGNQRPSCDPESDYAASWGGQPWWKKANPCPNLSSTFPVASFPPNPWGLYDMLGNVHEWLMDCKNTSNYINSPNHSKPWVESLCTRRVVRGGAWTSDAANVSVSNRKSYDKSTVFERVGFRLARDIVN